MVGFRAHGHIQFSSCKLFSILGSTAKFPVLYMSHAKHAHSVDELLADKQYTEWLCHIYMPVY